MGRLWIAGFVALAACSPMPLAAPGPDPIPPEQDQCRASTYQYLVGRPRAEVPQQPAGATWRVTCSNCAVTMDYNPHRLNMVYDDRSEIIQSVRCG